MPSSGDAFGRAPLVSSVKVPVCGVNIILIFGFRFRHSITNSGSVSRNEMTGLQRRFCHPDAHGLPTNSIERCTGCDKLRNPEGDQMSIKGKPGLAVVAFAISCSQLMLAQVAPPSILEIDLENKVQYHEDVAFDPSKFATDQGATSVTRPRNFGKFVSVADIVAVNGQPVKGLALYNTRVVTLRAIPANPGEGIADTDRNGVIDQMFEILRTDGTPIGTILATGLAAGAAPPGSPLEVVQGNLTISGGTGAFFGARGAVGQGPTTTPDRIASMTEDPGNRRKLGGGKVRIVVRVIPLSQPQIAVSSGSPTLFHADFTAVTTTQPARAGETLIAMVTGLGPTTPSVDPGKPFPLYPAGPLQLVNAPVEVSVNGQLTPSFNAIGWPGLVDTYRLDFQIPDGVQTGSATVQLKAAWISGPAVTVPIQ